jgi:hypothetical protein
LTRIDKQIATLSPTEKMFRDLSGKSY